MKRKVAVIGAGTMGGVHAAAYAAMPEVELVGIADARHEVAVALAERHATRGFPDWRSMVDAEGPELVDVCLPTDLHARQVIELAELGLDIVCEKPIARTLAEAREMIDACKRHRVRLFVGHVVRFFPAYCLARTRIADGQIGLPATAFAMRGGAFPGGWKDWYADEQRSGSLILDLMIHDFDFLRWTLGEVERVYAKSLGRASSDRVDHAFVSLRFAGGTIASVEGTWAYPSGFRTAFEFAGREGIITHDSEREQPLQSFLKGEGADGAAVAVPESPLVKSPYRIELEHFIHCLSTGEEARVTPEDAYRALEVALAAIESASNGRPMEVGR